MSLAERNREGCKHSDAKKRATPVFLLSGIATLLGVFSKIASRASLIASISWIKTSNWNH
jgi:hypothetical protein